MSTLKLYCLWNYARHPVSRDYGVPNVNILKANKKQNKLINKYVQGFRLHNLISMCFIDVIISRRYLKKNIL